LFLVVTYWLGELSYCHVIPKPGDRGTWLSGSYSTGLNISIYSEACQQILAERLLGNKALPEKVTTPVRLFTVVHTHPSLGPQGAKVPPSLLDILTFTTQHHEIPTYFEPPITFRMIMVEADRVWEVSVRDVPKFEKFYDHLKKITEEPSLVKNKKSAEVTFTLDPMLHIASVLEPIYVCEAIHDLSLKASASDMLNQAETTLRDCDTVTLKEREQATDQLLEIYANWGILITETPRGQAI